MNDGDQPVQVGTSQTKSRVEWVVQLEWERTDIVRNYLCHLAQMKTNKQKWDE